ncbi:MAG: hypothetical protein IAF08_15195 [Rhizobacter sp.]|nr:hypothetical protein [Chlorobiales bacterium]
MLKQLFTKKSKEATFWDWFSKNSDKYFHFEKNQNTIFPKLKTELEKIHPDLTFEFSSILHDGTREFVVSADGIKSVFPLVTDLVKQAPIIPRWKIRAFRQPRREITQLTYQSLTINFEDVFFRYAKDNGKVGLELNIRGFYESPEWNAAAFILLDNVLGEYDTEMSLSYIDKKALDENEVGNLFPIKALPRVIQDCRSELNN